MNDLIDELLRDTKQLQDKINWDGDYQEIRWLVHGWAKKWQPTIFHAMRAMMNVHPENYINQENYEHFEKKSGKESSTYKRFYRCMREFEENKGAER